MILKNRFLKIVLCVSLLCAIFCTPVFAASEDSPQPSEVPSDFDLLSSLVSPEEYKDPVYQYLASGDGVRAVTYTTTDIYNLLSIALYNEGTTNTWSLPRIAYYTHLTNTNTSSIHQDLRDIHFILNGDYSGIYVRPSIQESLFRVDGNGNFITLSDAIADFPSLTYSAVNQLISAQQNGNYYLSQINSNLSGSISWSNTSSLYFGTRLELFGNNLSADTASSHFVSGFTFAGISQPQLIRIEFPTYKDAAGNINVEDFKIDSITFGYNGNFASVNVPYDYFFQQTTHSLYLYLFDFNFMQDPNASYWFDISYSEPYSFKASSSASVVCLSFDTDDFQQIKQAFYQQKTGNSLGSMSSDLDRLADYLADPDKIAAEQASQQVIDDTLDGFTGNGSAAVKGSDVGSMKNMSGSIQSGLDSGGSASDAVSVFSTNSGFWSWFTQATSDGINNAYPAPQVNQRRGSGDEIPDFISGDKEELDALRNRRDRW